eukprot:TRINITY_DN2375_c0_g2_i1.p1 TRINITY_DN2375_c0_g2~~TRINITY_DN2375_c0_g2_i1.p1  ORF type:complete len:475 (-),score=114.46 TRINITY_DN2375_c0_g2_i1:52-1476(-)
MSTVIVAWHCRWSLILKLFPSCKSSLFPNAAHMALARAVLSAVTLTLLCLLVTAQVGRVAVISQETDLFPFLLRDVADIAVSSNRFAAVSTYNLYNGSVSLSDLVKTDVILVWNYYPTYPNFAALGDLIADYLDSGRHVVLMDTDFGITGRFQSKDYNPFSYTNGSYATVAGAQLVPVLPAHPILHNVQALTYYWTTFVSLGSNAVLIAQSDTAMTGGVAYPLVAEKQPSSSTGHIVGLNYLPIYRTSTQRSPVWFWHPDTNGTLIWLNALSYLLSLPAPVQPSPSPEAVVIAPADVTIQCDSWSDPSVTGSATSASCANLTYSDTYESGASPVVHIIVRTWSTGSNCPIPASAQQQIRVVDTQPPVLTVPADITLPRGSDRAPNVTGEASAVDSCDSAPVVSYSDQLGLCDVERMWRAEDSRGNAVQAVQKLRFDDPWCEALFAGAVAAPQYSVVLMLAYVLSVVAFAAVLAR